MNEMVEKRKDYPEILKKLDYVCGKVESIDKDFRGNGEPGIKERLRNVENFVLEFKSFHKQIQKTIIGSAGTIVTSIIIAMLIYFLIPKGG